MNKWFFALVQFFPLSFFATYAFWHGPPSDERWSDAFQFGAFFGLLQLLTLIFHSRPVNRLILAGNLYLIFGGLAFFFQQWWFLQLYDLLRESAIFILMIIVGLIATCSSSSGFIAIHGSERKFSVFLLFATILALPIAQYFEGNHLYSAVIPILFLAILQRYLALIAKSKTECDS